MIDENSYNILKEILKKSGFKDIHIESPNNKLGVTFVAENQKSLLEKCSDLSCRL